MTVISNFRTAVSYNDYNGLFGCLIFYEIQTPSAASTLMMALF